MARGSCRSARLARALSIPAARQAGYRHAPQARRLLAPRQALRPVRSQDLRRSRNILRRALQEDCEVKTSSAQDLESSPLRTHRDRTELMSPVLSASDSQRKLPKARRGRVSIQPVPGEGISTRGGRGVRVSSPVPPRGHRTCLPAGGAALVRCARGVLADRGRARKRACALKNTLNTLHARKRYQRAWLNRAVPDRQFPHVRQGIKVHWHD